MKYELQDLLNVRKIREDNAAAEVTLRRQLVAEAEQNVVRRKQELQDYIQWRIQREQELYDSVMQQEVHLNDLEELKLDVQILRDKEHAYKEKIIEAEKQLKDAQDNLETAKQKYTEAVRNREKLDEHKKIWTEEAEKEQEFEAEKEMEDFRTKQPAI